MKVMKITRISGLEVLDSRGNPTVKAYVTLDNGITGWGTVPSGASTGKYEARELRDGDAPYQGQDVKKAIGHVNESIASVLHGKPIENLQSLDSLMLELDNNPQKKNIGANAVLAVSIALTRTLSMAKDQPLWKTLHEHYFSSWQPSFPRIMVNVINGGAHADWNIDFQEYMLVPREAKPSESVRQAAEIFHTLKKILKDRGEVVAVGDEGGFAPQLEDNTQGFALLDEAIKKAGYHRSQIDLAVDVAASEFYKNGTYHLLKENKILSSSELASYFASLIKDYDIASFEDPFAEDDWHGFKAFTKTHGHNRLIVGDDLFVTNRERIKKGIEEEAANAVLIKLNQIGSVYETVQAIEIARKAGWKVIISHRSGETEDPFIADLAFACSADFIKTGSMSRSEHLAKYNRLLEIEARELIH